MNKKIEGVKSTQKEKPTENLDWEERAKLEGVVNEFFYKFDDIVDGIVFPPDLEKGTEIKEEREIHRDYIRFTIKLDNGEIIHKRYSLHDGGVWSTEPQG